jgi:3-hydroxyisobutyrate dehydrogenase-like beta-hydroxyacid dehydrogenase
MKIGFVGLGQMGSGIAANLLKAGHELSIYNRSIGKTEALVAQGATLAKTPAAACQGDVVFTMLADDAAVETVVFGETGILGALKKGAIHVSCTTISVKFSEKLTEAHAKAGQRYIAAPVFGRPDAAAAAKLFVAAAGEAQALKEVAPLFDVIGQRTYVVSDKPAAANLVKLSGNFLLASVIESLGEAMALVSKGGIDRHIYLDLLTSSLFSSPVYRTYGAMIADQKFSPAGFAASLGQKDIRLALAAADELRVPMPLASLLHDRFLTLMATGGEQLDWSAIAGLAAKDSGQ